MSGPLLPANAQLPNPPPLDAPSVQRWAAAFTKAVNHLYRTLVSRIEDMIQDGLATGKPAAAGSRRFFFETDTKDLYYDDGTWEKITGGGSSSGTVPIGGIIMWSGTIATIPANWALCDGTANAPGPDLRDKFVVGAKQDSGGAAKTNIRGSLEQSASATGHSHSGHANLSHAGGAVADHTGLTHGLTIANHPDLTHAALSHAASSFSIAAHASGVDVSVPAHTHASALASRPAVNIASGVDVSVPAQTIASQLASRPALAHTHASAVDISVPAQTIASGVDISIASLSVASNASVAGVASFATSTNRSGLISLAAHSHSVAAHSGSRPALNVAAVSGSRPALAATNASGVDISVPALPVASVLGSRPAGTQASGVDVSVPAISQASQAASRPSLAHSDISFPSLSHQDIGTHLATNYGVHTFTAPAAHGTAGTLTHSFTQPGDHTISAHDTVSMVPSFFALAFIERML